MHDHILVRFDIYSPEVSLRPWQPAPDAAERQTLAPFSFSTFLGFHAIEACNTLGGP